MRKIYDCFIFFNELDLLELRFNILDEYVDYFVLCEADVTHSGLPKSYIFEDNKERFSKFLHKIIHIKIDDIPTDFTNLPTIDTPKSFDEECLKDIYKFIRDTKLFIHNIHPHYGRDFFQKESVRRGLKNCSEDDIIILSDCDEIPNPEVLLTVNKFIDTEPFFTLQQTTYYYYMNLLKEHNWRGSRIGRYKNIKHYSFNELRAQRNCEVSKGGWHFSFMGGREEVKNKIKSYSHQELNNPDILNKIDFNIENNIDPFSRSNLELVPIDESYPKYLLDNIEKYKHMIKTKHKPTLYTNVGINNEFEEFDRPVSIFVERYNEEELKTNNVNIWMDGCEPPELSHGWFNPHDVINNHEKFDLILTRDPQILENCDNAHVFPFGGIMVESLSQENKKDKISFLCGSKNYLPGHKFRNIILNNKHIFDGNMELDFHYQIGRKHDIFKDSKYSIVVENTQHENYFTEKIVDCLLSKTIPIYWGCPNINEYFNMKSIITFNNIEELSDIIKKLDSDYYDNNIRNINDNFIRATNYSYYYTRVSNIIKHYLF